MKRIKDPIHGYIKIEGDIVEKIIDTEHFQRLRYLRQVSGTYMVYPSAHHTRFEHCLGVFYLGTKVFEVLEKESDFANTDGDLDRIKKTLKCACLLHDIGHLPFSHLCEEFVDKDKLVSELEGLGFIDELDAHDVREGANAAKPVQHASPHELLGCIVVLRDYRESLEDLGVDPYEVCAYMLGVSLTGSSEGVWQHDVAAKIIHSPIDVDRLDYIMRDNFMTGASVVNIDSRRMVEAYTTSERTLTLSEKALSTIGNYLDGRISIYMWVTQHHKVVYTHALIKMMITELTMRMDENPFTSESVYEHAVDDNYLLQKFREHAMEADDSTLADLYERFQSRDFLASCWKHKVDYNDTIRSDRIDSRLSRDIDNDQTYVRGYLAEKLDVPLHEVAVTTSYVPSYDPGDLSEIFLSHGDTVRQITHYDIYEPDSFPEPIPYVFVPEEKKEEAISVINEDYLQDNH